jgi:hypothetical protein
VIVGEKNGRACVRGCVQDDLAKREIDAARVAKVARQMNAARLIVEVRDPQAFLVGPLFGEAAGEEGAGGGDAGELERDFGTLTTHSLRVSEAPGSGDEKRVGFGAESEEFAADWKKGP